MKILKSKIFLMQPRQSGKSEKAMIEFLKSPDDSIIITNNFDNAEFIKEKSGNSILCISSRQYLNNFKNDDIKTFILDEYMFYSNKEKLYNKINKSSIEKLFICSTTDKKYNKVIFEFIKENKINYTYDELLINFISLFPNNNKKEFDELYYNFLTDSDVILIDSVFNTSNKKTQRYHQDNEIYDMEIKNIYFK